MADVLQRQRCEKFLRDWGIIPIPPSGDYLSVTETRGVPQAGAQQDGPRLIGVVAPLIAASRIKDLLWVFETLKFVNLHFHAMIFGEGPLREGLRRFRDQWQLEDRVHFLGTLEQARHAMPYWDVLLDASEDHGSPFGVLQAITLGIPVIATDNPGARLLFQQGAAGALIPDCGHDFRLRRRTFVENTLHFLERHATWSLPVEPRISVPGVGY